MPSKTFYGIIKHRKNYEKKNYETVTSTSTDFRWRWVTTIDNIFPSLCKLKVWYIWQRIVEDCSCAWEDWKWRKWGMEQENGERIGAFGVFYPVDMSTWGRHFVVTDAHCLRPEVTYFAGKKLKIDRSVKMPWHRLSKTPRQNALRMSTDLSFRSIKHFRLLIIIHCKQGKIPYREVWKQKVRVSRRK